MLSPYPVNALARQLEAPDPSPRPYTVQYQETNFAFLSRLAAEHGAWFYYDGTSLRLGPEWAAPLPFHSNSAQAFALAMGLRPTRTEGASYDYRRHAPRRATAAPPPGGYALTRFAVAQSAALFPEPQRLALAPGQDQARLQRALDERAAHQAGAHVALTGHGELVATRPGRVLEVHDAQGLAYGPFRVLAVSHHLDGVGNYENHFQAQPAAADVPPVHPAAAPPAGQPELAEVIDGADPRGLGRVRVRYYWPVAQARDAETDWLRVSTPYSGDGKGQLFTPEVGSQARHQYLASPP